MKSLILFLVGINICIALGMNCVEDKEETYTKNWTVASIIAWPFLDTTTDNETTAEYTGFIKDLMDKFAGKLGASYEFVIQKDEKYGKKVGDKYDGMIGKVCDGVATLAAAPLTVTAEREEGIDFTYPYMTYQAVALTRQNDEVNSLQDLIDSGYRFATLSDGVILKSLSATSAENKQHMSVFSNINEHNGLVASNQEGISSAREDLAYAFLIESSLADVVVRNPPCDLKAINTGIYQRRFAIAVQQRSSLRDALNKEIVEMQYDGSLDKLYETWFGEDRCSGCTAVNASVFSLLAAIFACLYHRFS